MRACLTTELAPEEAVEAARKAPSMEGCNIVDKIGSHPMTPEEVDALVTDTELPPVEHDIVAFDFGIKYNILRPIEGKRLPRNRGARAHDGGGGACHEAGRRLSLQRSGDPPR